MAEYAMFTSTGLRVASAHAVVMDCHGDCIFGIRRENGKLEFPGGWPEPCDGQDPARAAAREFQEEILPLDWTLDDLPLIGTMVIPSVKREGTAYTVSLFVSSRPFVTSLSTLGLFIDTSIHCEETNGCAIFPWNKLPSKLIEFQAKVFVQAADIMVINNIGRLPLTQRGQCIINDAIWCRETHEIIMNLAA